MKMNSVLSLLVLRCGRGFYNQGWKTIFVGRFLAVSLHISHIIMLYIRTSHSKGQVSSFKTQDLGAFQKMKPSFTQGKWKQFRGHSAIPPKECGCSHILLMLMGGWECEPSRVAGVHNINHNGNQTCKNRGFNFGTRQKLGLENLLAEGFDLFACLVLTCKVMIFQVFVLVRHTPSWWSYIQGIWKVFLATFRPFLFPRQIKAIFWPC